MYALCFFAISAEGSRFLNKQDSPRGGPPAKGLSSFRQLSFLDRFLAVWIFLAMALGIILGYFVPNIGRALQRGKFVGVSVPIGKSRCGPTVAVAVAAATAAKHG